MTRPQASFELCENGSNKKNHSTELVKLIGTAQRFECVVAFANSNVLRNLLPALEEGLMRGMKARFTVGLSYFHTQPKLLRELLLLSKKKYPFNLSLYVLSSPYDDVFHPKVYAALTKSNGSNVLIGSANFTLGGLQNNHELSSHLTSYTQVLFRKFSDYVDALIDQEVVLEADEALINQYEVQYQWQRRYRQLAEKKAEVAAATEDATLEDALKDDFLADNLETMRRERSDLDPAKSRFEAEVARRKGDLPAAKGQLDAIAADRNISKASMLANYDMLVCNPRHLWHSGNLHRTRRLLANSAKGFRDALIMLNQLDLHAESAESAYSKLRDAMENVGQAGVNVMTEILHTYDSLKFPVMNQNSVAGALFAFPGAFPPKPTRANVPPEVYADFAEKCTIIRNQLGLENFSQLDALFNYIYWS